jgi:hypothetical protein
MSLGWGQAKVLALLQRVTGSHSPEENQMKTPAVRKATLPFLSGGIIGMACGVFLGPSPTAPIWSAMEGQVRYQGQPTTYWIAQLQDQDPCFRQQAVRALEQIGARDVKVVSALAGMLTDSSTAVRIGAAFALRRFGPEAVEAVPSLIHALQDRDGFVRINSAAALRSICPQDESVNAVIVPLVKDESPVVRRAILKMLKQVDSRDISTLIAVHGAQKFTGHQPLPGARDTIAKTEPQ